jgi:GNAT superfamily N-acetyltransferase
MSLRDLIAYLAEVMEFISENRAAEVGTKRTWGKPPEEYQVVKINKGWKRVKGRHVSAQSASAKPFSQNVHFEKPIQSADSSIFSSSSSALAAISEEAKRPNSLEYHKNFLLGKFQKDPNFGQEKSDFESTVSSYFKRKITLEELTHGFAVPDGFTATLGTLVMQDAHLGTGSSITWRIEDSEGLNAGYLRRGFGTTPQGESFIEHASLFLKPEYQGKGISDTINGNAFRHYEKWGVKEIHVDAVQVGQYAWARLGFNFTSSFAALEQFNIFSNSLPLEIREKSREIASHLVKEPWKLAKWDIGLKINGNPIGKAFLLARNAWQGIMKIDRKNEGYLTAISKSKVAV